MVAKNRKSGIKVLGAVPWGAHICLLFDTKRDLITTTLPYIKAGLENNESCLWITSDSPGIKKVGDIIKKKTPYFSSSARENQIDILPLSSVGAKAGELNLLKLHWIMADRLKRAIDTGYDGLRVAFDLSWAEKAEWKKMTAQIAKCRKTNGKFHMLAFFAYPLDKCGLREYINLIGDRKFNLIVSNGKLTQLGGSRFRKSVGKNWRQLFDSVIKSPLTPLQNRFAVSGLKGFSDEEILELLLSICPYNQDRHLLSQITKNFKNIRRLLAASPEELIEAGLTRWCIDYIKLFREIPVKVLEEKIEEQPIYDSPQDIFDYLYFSMRDLKKEVFKVIYLDSRNQIIKMSDLFTGTLDKITVNTREVVEFAVTNNAKSLIFVHNHPSGDPSPSSTDKRLTRDLVFVGNILQIRVLDHIIIGENRYFSFASEGLIKEYETDFLNLKITSTAEAKRKSSRTKLPFSTGIINLIAG